MVANGQRTRISTRDVTSFGNGTSAIQESSYIPRSPKTTWLRLDSLIRLLSLKPWQEEMQP